MKLSIRTCSAVFLASLLCASAGVSQIQKKAQVGFRFLENPTAAEAVGRGGTGILTTMNSNALFWNPALTGWQTSAVDLSLNHTRYIADINYSAGAATFRLGSFGVLGASLLMMDYGTFYQTYAVDKSVNEQGYVETGTFSPKSYALGLSFSQQVSDRFSYGVQLKYVAQDLGDAWVAQDVNIVERGYKANAMALDIGAVYDFAYKGIKFAATMQNISKEIRYENESFPLPFAVSFGACVQPLTFIDESDAMKALMLTVESRHQRDFGEKLKVGAEYKAYEFFALRAGYMTGYDERGFTAGLGITYPVSGVPLRADYAYEPFGVFGGVHYLSLGVSY
ncbi:MAG: PorV/PorQ family protein [Acidobacteriota bacterium]